MNRPVAPEQVATNHRVDDETLLAMFRATLRIRRFEERTIELFQEGVVKGTAHSYIGQEAIAAGVCQHLTAADSIGSYHRGHGHSIAKGARLDMMMAELMGRETGYCGGLGGSMHIADLDLNILGSNGIVGATMPLGAGAALAAKIRGTRDVTVAFFGDGANNQGVFHEALNLAAVWKLPMIFVCENNHWALTTSFRESSAIQQVADRAVAYGVPGRTIDGNDAVEVHAVVGEAVERARAGEGPSLIEAMTWRWGQHSARTNLPDPRKPEDTEIWMRRDPVQLLEWRIEAQVPDGLATVARIREQVEEEIAQAEAFGRAGAEPTMASLKDAVYAPHIAHVEPADHGVRKLTYVQALNEAIHQEMDRDETVFAMGEDIGFSDGLFTVTKGLLDRFGPARVRDTPISEAAFAGAGVGAAISGMRPIVEIQIFDFVTQMMDMIVNQAAKFRFMNGGKAKVPIVFRGPQGSGIRLAAQHSQSLEAWFAHIPGLVVLAPSTPFDAKGLMTAAIRDDNPVIFLEHKLLYLGQTMPVPEQPYAIPIGKGDIKKVGTDVTIVATMAMVARALSAAKQLERDGVSCEIIDPRTIHPLDKDMILDSVRKTNRMVVVHEAVTNFGFGAEVSAMVMEEAFDWLDAPVVRLGAMNVPVPFNDTLEQAILPSQTMIVDAVKGLFG